MVDLGNAEAGHYGQYWSTWVWRWICGGKSNSTEYHISYLRSCLAKFMNNHTCVIKIIKQVVRSTSSALLMATLLACDVR